MALKYKASLGHLILVAWLAVTCFAAVQSLYASTLNIEIQNSKIHVQADQVPLIDILTAVSEKTGISLKIGDSLEELVSFNIEAASIEDGIRRILSHRSYVLLYEKLENRSFSPIEIRVFGSKTLKAVTPLGPYDNTQMAVSGPDDHIKRYPKRWFEKELENSGNISKKILAKPITDISKPITDISNRQDPMPGGIQVTMVAKDSIFSKIGIKQGDFIHDVNGSPVNTVEEFVDGIQLSSEDPPIIRIDRLNSNRETDPIYIELH